ncbi:hypothetical protein MPER_09800 [Moniliophthora perniciosa FA553]|nr:hypothetical protein MPER_09800 [Moniliophthora perniciosa FA553]
MEKTLSKDNHYTPDQVEELFKSYLKASPSVELCSLYIIYIRSKSHQCPHQDKVLEAFKFVLNLVGYQAESVEFWDQYMNILQEAGEDRTLRDALHEVVKLPLENLPYLWDKLQRFEHVHNESTAKQVLAELLPAYADGLIAFREFERLTRLIYYPEGCQHLLQIVQRWTAYLQWEESDPLMLRKINTSAFLNKLRNAYQKATSRMRYYPELWLVVILTYTSREDFGTVYIAYMQFALRVKGLDGVRFVFVQASEDAPLTPWHVYEAAAMTEYQHGGDEHVSRQIFRDGMVHFGGDTNYVMCYLEWLISIDDQNDARALLEAANGRLSAQDALQLWDRWARAATDDYQ